MDRVARSSLVRWTLSAAGAIVVVTFLLLLLRPPPNLPPAALRVGERPVVEVQTGGTVLSGEEALLRDKSPLFLPTEWNARTNVLPHDAVGEPGGTFPGYRVEFLFPEDVARVSLPSPVAVPETPVEALTVGVPDAPFFGFGRTNREVAPPPSRDAFVQIVEEGSGSVVLERRLTGLTLPEARAWAPMEFVVAVEPTGLVGLPVVYQRSGADQIDSFFQEYLARTLRIGERLIPGFYRIKVAP